MLLQADSSSWNLQTASHLLSRVGFGGTPAEVAALQKLGRRGAIEMLLKTPVAAPGPELSNIQMMPEIRTEMRDLGPAERKSKTQELRRQSMEDLVKVRSWWLQQMVRPESAVQEKLTLFWHGHFATSIQKVKSARFMWQQNQLFRRFALGNFRDLVKAISCDPAMVVWLDLQQSREGAPNENFARELMELFTLGIGHYTEDDIQASARAFTGYRARPGQGVGFSYQERQHDDSEKTFMGKTGRFGGDDIIDMICAQPACAEFICEKLWTFYAYEDPEPGIVQSLGETFRRGNYEMRPLMEEMLGSAAFYSAKALGTQIKSPAQLIAQTSRTLECPLPPGYILQNAMRGLGQVLFAPPNVKGWDGNRSWINTATLGNRAELTDGLAGTGPLARRYQVEIPLEKLVTNDMLNHADKLVDGLTQRLLSTTIAPATREELIAGATKYPTPLTRTAVRETLAQIMRLPEFQLV